MLSTVRNGQTYSFSFAIHGAKHESKAITNQSESVNRPKPRIIQSIGHFHINWSTKVLFFLLPRMIRETHHMVLVSSSCSKCHINLLKKFNYQKGQRTRHHLQCHLVSLINHFHLHAWKVLPNNYHSNHQRSTNPTSTFNTMICYTLPLSLIVVLTYPSLHVRTSFSDFGSFL